MTNFNMRLDVRKAASNIPQIRLGQGDNTTTLTVEVLDNGAPYVFAEGEHLVFVCVRPDGKWVHLSEALVQSGNKWICTLDEHVTDAAGVISVCYFDIRDENDTTHESTDRFELVVLPSATAHANLASYSDQVDRLLRECHQLYDAWKGILKQWEEDEVARKQAEEERVNNETERVADENIRKNNESVRLAQEEEREANEETRIANENFRIAKFEEYDARAKGWARYVCTEGEFDPVSRVPTLPSPNTGTLYYVPILEADQEEGNRYEEWTYTELGWEQLGKADMFYSAISAEEIDQVLAGEHVEGQAAVTTSALSYLWPGMNDVFGRKFSAIGHNHNLEDLEGSLPVSKINLDSGGAAIALAAWPVGSIYQSFDPTSPAALFGGEWEQLTDVFLRAGNDTSTGGSDSVTLTTANMPSHTHAFTGSAVTHGHTFTGTKAAHKHTFTGTAASHDHTFTGAKWTHNHAFTGTAASHNHVPTSPRTPVNGGWRFVVIDGANIEQSLSWSSASSVSSGAYAPWTKVNYDWATDAQTSSTSITPAGTINNKDYWPSGTVNGKSITPAGTINDVNLIPAGTISNGSVTAAGTNASVGGGEAFDNRPAYQNVYTWKRVA